MPKALNDISTWHAVGLYWVLGHAGVQGIETLDELARAALFWGSLDLNRPWEPLEGICRKGFVFGWQTSTGQDGEAVAIHKDRYRE